MYRLLKPNFLVFYLMMIWFAIFEKETFTRCHTLKFLVSNRPRTAKLGNWETQNLDIGGFLSTYTIARVWGGSVELCEWKKLVCIWQLDATSKEGRTNRPFGKYVICCDKKTCFGFRINTASKTYITDNFGCQRIPHHINYFELVIEWVNPSVTPQTCRMSPSTPS